MTSVKIWVMSFADSASSRRFSATMPPKAETGSQASARSYRLRQRGSFGDAAGVRVLDDDDRRRAGGVEFGDAFEGGVRCR